MIILSLFQGSCGGPCGPLPLNPSVSCRVDPPPISISDPPPTFKVDPLPTVNPLPTIKVDPLPTFKVDPLPKVDPPPTIKVDLPTLPISTGPPSTVTNHQG